MSSSLRFCFQALALAAGLAAAAPAAMAGSGTIYVSRMPDGSLSLGDRPAAGAASSIRRDYVVQTPEQRASADRDRGRLREEADGFQRRYESSRRMQVAAEDGRQGSYGRQEIPATHPWLYGAGLVHRQAQAPAYTSSPGVLQGRTTPFIGSGFSSSR